MKKALFIMMALVTCSSVMYAAPLLQPSTTNNSNNDTLVVNYPRKVTVITGDSLQTVRVEGRHDDDNFRYENTIQLVDSNYVSNVSINPDRWEFSLNPFHDRTRVEKWAENEVTTHLGFGWCNALGTPENMDIAMGSSCEIFWTIAQWDYSKRHSRSMWSIGGGLDWRNYRMTGHQRFTKTDDDRVVITPYESKDISKQYSRIKILSLHIPLLYSYHIGNGFRLSAGPVLYINTHSSLKTKYKDSEGKHKEKAADARVNPITFDLIGIIRTPAIDLYVKYSPCNVLKSNYAPKFQSLSIGLYL